VEQHYRDHGYSVRSNDPYKGGWITREYGEPDAGRHAIQIEVNRDLYMDEEYFEVKESGMAKLRRVCSELLEKLGSLELSS
jgi:N-formylglutamate amidohydrolase